MRQRFYSGRNPNDWDITTSCFSAAGEGTVPAHGGIPDCSMETVTVLMDKEGYEVTTYRVDGDYEDGRHPKQVMLLRVWKKI